MWFCQYPGSVVQELIAIPNSAYLDQTRKFFHITLHKHWIFTRTHKILPGTQKSLIHAPKTKYSSPVVSSVCRIGLKISVSCFNLLVLLLFKSYKNYLTILKLNENISFYNVPSKWWVFFFTNRWISKGAALCEMFLINAFICITTIHSVPIVDYCNWSSG